MILALAAALVLPGSVDLPLNPIQVKESRPLSGIPTSGTLMGRHACDSKRNIYVPVGQINPKSGVVTEYSLYRLSEDGELNGRFTISASDRDAKVRGFNFAVSADGRVKELVRRPEANASKTIVQDYWSDGQPKSQTELQINGDFFPSQFAFTGEGRMFVSGTRVSRGPDGVDREPLTGIFEPNGQLFTTKILKGDEPGHLEGIEGGSAFRADDGNFWVVRAGSQPRVLKLSSLDGRRLQDLAITSPFPYSVMDPVFLGDRLAIMYTSKSSEAGKYAIKAIVEYDLNDGSMLRAFKMPTDRIFTLACYLGPGEFIVLSGREQGDGIEAVKLK